MIVAVNAETHGIDLLGRHGTQVLEKVVLALEDHVGQLHLGWGQRRTAPAQQVEVVPIDDRVDWYNDRW